MDGAVGQMARRLEADGLERERIVGADLAFLLDKEQLVVGRVGRQEPDAAAVQSKAIQRRHPQDGVGLRVILLLDPVGELAVKRFERGEV